MQNGRIILDQSVPNVFDLYDKNPIKRIVTPYSEALNGIMENTILSNTFFSIANIQIVQNNIRAGVHQKSKGKFLIPEQNSDSLKIIMRKVFLEHSLNLSYNISSQIEALNHIIEDICVPQIMVEAETYVKFRHDLNTLSVPIDRPKSTFTNNLIQQKPWM